MLQNLVLFGSSVSVANGLLSEEGLAEAVGANPQRRYHGLKIVEADEMSRWLQILTLICALVCIGLSNFLAIRVVESVLGREWYVPGLVSGATTLLWILGLNWLNKKGIPGLEWLKK